MTSHLNNITSWLSNVKDITENKTRKHIFKLKLNVYKQSESKLLLGWEKIVLFKFKVYSMQEFEREQLDGCAIKDLK